MANSREPDGERVVGGGLAGDAAGSRRVGRPRDAAVGEAIRTPELLEILRRHAVEPRVALVEKALGQLQERGEVRAGIDAHTIATMCFGAYFAAFYRGEDREDIPKHVVAVLWPGIAAHTSATKRDSGAGRSRQPASPS